MRHTDAVRREDPKHSLQAKRAAGMGSVPGVAVIGRRNTTLTLPVMTNAFNILAACHTERYGLFKLGRLAPDNPEHPKVVESPERTSPLDPYSFYPRSP